MDINHALLAFDALSQDTRLRTYRELIKAGPEGRSAGSLSSALETPHNTLSFHLKHLKHAGLIEASRDGRSIIYTARYDQMRSLIQFLIDDCCGAGVMSVRRERDATQTSIELTDCCQPDDQHDHVQETSS